MVLLAAAAPGSGVVLIELGLVITGLAVLGRLAGYAGLSAIPLYLLAGLLFGSGGVAPLALSEGFISLGGEIGIILLLFMLGLEYTARELRDGLRAGLSAGLVDALLNFTPGLVAGLLLGWGAVGATLLGGVTYISSSGVIAKVLDDLGRLGNRETPAVLSLLVLEDLAMAAYLPIVAVVLAGGGLAVLTGSLALAAGAVILALTVGLRYGGVLSRLVAARSDEVLLLTVFGLVVAVAGVAEQLQISSAVGAFLVGIALSGEVADRARTLLRPLRDLFAAVFFLFFGLQIDPSQLPAVAVVAVVLAAVTAATKVATGWWAAGRHGIRRRGRLRAGATLVARGEFSIVVADLGVAAAVHPRLGVTAAAYVLVLAVTGPLLARVADPVGAWLDRRALAQAPAGAVGPAGS